MFRLPAWSAISLILSAASVAFAQSPTVGNCTVFPANNIWNTPVEQLSVSPSSSAWVTTIGPTKPVHADFGSGLYQGAPIGIPYITVPGTQQKYPVSFTYADESDPGPYAIPLTAPIEGGAQSTGDRHTLSIDTDNCILYELYAAYPQAASWTAGSGAIFNLLSNDGLGQPYFDPNAFGPVTTARFGSSGRDLLRGPGVFNLDGSLFRKFRMTERFGLEIRCEMFGVTNTPQFGNPGATVSSITRNTDGSIKALNGYTEITSATGERQARFAAKITF